jgi:hypothetical protein
MKTSANNTRLIDQYLLGQMAPGDQLVFDARLMLCPDLQDTLEWQQQVHQLIKLRGRQQLQAQIKQVEQKLFTEHAHQSFRDKIFRLFGK